MLRSLFSALFLAALVAAAGPRTDLPQAQRALASLPPRFEVNRGQFDAAVKFAARASDSALAVYGDGARLGLAGGWLRMTLAGGNPAAATEGLDPLSSRSNYILGNRRSEWKFGIPHYARVRARGVYPGVDMVYYFTGQRVEYDVVIAPGADPSAVRLRFSGALSTRLSPDGSLLFDLGGRQVRQLAPAAYQQDGASRRPVPVSYRLAPNGEVAFSLGDYDRRKTLVVDPVIDSSILFAGYLQGNGYDVVKAATLDQNGNLWLTGWSSGAVSQLPPAQNTPYQFKAGGLKDVFIAEIGFDATTGQGTLIYWTYIGELSGNEEGNAIVVGPDGKVYITGYTTSGAYPTAGTVLQTGLTGLQDAIISVIDPSLSDVNSLVYSSYYGGDVDDTGTALALAPDGTVYIAGYTSSATIPGTDQNVVLPFNRGGWDVFLAHIDPHVDATVPLLYGTFFGGGSTDVATNIALDPAGNIWLAGYSMSTDFPVTGDAYQNYLRSMGDLFLAKFDLTRGGLDGLRYCTFIGGDNLDIPHGMALDANGVIWMSGYTLSSDFPTTSNAYQSSAPGGVSGFLLGFDTTQTSGQPLVYSTYAGWGRVDIPNAMALMPSGRVALAGYTMSPGFPLVGSTWNVTPKIRMSDAFVAVFDPSKAGTDALAYSALYGSALNDTATALAAGPDNMLYVGGTTISSDLPVTDGSSKLSVFGLTTSFVLKVKPVLPALPQSSAPNSSH